MFFFLTSLALAGEHALDPAALPPAVTAAVQARYPGATLTAAAQEGKEYEATVTVGERHLDLAFAADGTWLEEEERVTTEELPAPVTSALDTRWKGWTVASAERATTPKGTTYEVVVKSGARSAEVVLSDAGVVKRVEQGEEEGEEK